MIAALVALAGLLAGGTLATDNPPPVVSPPVVLAVAPPVVLSPAPVAVAECGGLRVEAGPYPGGGTVTISVVGGGSMEMRFASGYHGFALWPLGGQAAWRVIVATAEGSETLSGTVTTCMEAGP